MHVNAASIIIPAHGNSVQNIGWIVDAEKFCLTAARIPS